MKEVRSVFINISIHAGSWYEESDSWGAFHFLEHLLFTGTEKFPTHDDIENFKYEHGINFNGSTSGGEINFWFNLPDIELTSGLFLIDQIIFHPLIPINQFDKEISIINQEFENKWDNPQNRFNKFLYQNLLGKDNFINRDGLGQIDFIKKLNQSDLINLHHQYFQPQNMTISIVGNFDQITLIKTIKNIFENYTNTYKSKLKTTKIKKSKAIFNYYDNVNQSYLVMNWIKKKKYSLQERITLNMASFMIGSGSNSILFKKLRHQLGLVYNINSKSSTWLDIQNFEVWSSVENKNINKVIDIIKEEINQFLSKKIDPILFKKTRRYMDYQTLMSFDSVNNISNSLIKDLFYENKIYTPKEIINLAKKITPKQMVNLLKEIINQKNMTINVMTQIKPEN